MQRRQNEVKHVPRVVTGAARGRGAFLLSERRPARAKSALEAALLFSSYFDNPFVDGKLYSLTLS